MKLFIINYNDCKMNDLPVIPQKSSPLARPRSVKDEEIKGEKRCEWILERGDAKGTQCVDFVYIANEKYCSAHRGVLKKREIKKGAPKVNPFTNKDQEANPFKDEPLPEDIDDDLDDFELSAPHNTPIVKQPVEHQSLAIISNCNETDDCSDVLDILRSIMLLRLNRAGILKK